MARVACALRPVETRPTTHGARSAQRGLGVVVLWVVGQRGARSSPRRWLRLDSTNTATGRGHGLQATVVIAFEPRGARPARFWPREAAADRPQSSRAAQCGLGMVVLRPNAGRAPPHAVGQLRPNAGRAPPHAVGRGSTAPPLRQDGSTAFKFIATISFESRGARPACFLPCRVLVDRP